MLVELRVENYAVIDNVAVSFAPGLNLLTGETGAGKSILIDALSLVLGERASVDSIRHGAEKAVVTGVFEAGDLRVNEILEANGIDSEADEIIIRREISRREASKEGGAGARSAEAAGSRSIPARLKPELVAAAGKSRVFINNQPATVAVLKQIFPFLAAIHAQSETLASFDPEARLALLDAFAGADLEAVGRAFAGWNELGSQIRELEQREKDRLQLIDLWSFQKKEIEGAHLKPGEDVELEAEKRMLTNVEKLHHASSSAYDLLYESDASAIAALGAAIKHLQEMAKFDARFEADALQLQGTQAVIEDASATLRDYTQKLNSSPERLAEVEDRLAALDRLKRKYAPHMGGGLDAVITHGNEVSQKLDDLENREQILAQLGKQRDEAALRYLQAARELSRKRFDAAKKLEKQAEAEINNLAMRSRFKVEITGGDDAAEWTARGFDQVVYLIATNPGEPVKPVEQIASGGELSRIMLALKATVEAGKSPGRKGRSAQRTLVFDEIDAGVGGSAAEAVGKKLHSLARGNQVLCVTHLPQIACFADHHYLIEKKTSAARTAIAVRELSAGERREEIARMLSGSELTESSRRHAAELLKAVAQG